MGKKYLSIEEAARLLGMDPKELNRLREKGDIRAFADRGTWKFRQDEIEELLRTRQPDSNPEVPLGDYPDAGGSVLGDEGQGDDAGSAIILGRDADKLSEQPTIIRKGAHDESDSDVRLSVDEDLKPLSGESDIQLRGSDSDVRLRPTPTPAPGSDSDVKVVGGSSSEVTIPKDSGINLDEGSDSDVQLVGSKIDLGSDSDVRLVSPSETKLALNSNDEASDSDVALVSPKSGSSGSGKLKTATSDDELVAFEDSDEGSFVLGGTDSGIFTGGPSDSGILLDAGESGLAVGKDEESGIALDGGSSDIALDVGDSGIALDAGDSGIALDIGDSGIALDAGDSGIALGSESGIGSSGSGYTFQSPADSGIALDAGDSGKQKPKKPARQDMGGTIPMMPVARADDDLGDTQMEVPMLGGTEDSDFEFTSNALDDDSANVIMLDDDHGGAHGETVVKKRPGGDDELLEESVFDVQDGDDVVVEDDLEVAEDVIGEDDALEEEDIFGAEDEDFDEGLQTGQSAADFAVPAGRMAAPVEVEWGTGEFVGLAIGTLFMVIAGWVSYDLVHTMWSGNDLTGPTPALLGMFSSLFGK
ncbi:MAG TPA: helix-turn-helix domain-containing protein [Planctomycetaceae bacterium]|nr:helix-turn-helix domain-containing protein [Planctomycetaceae bacterium]